jgi:hypothetical protein
MKITKLIENAAAQSLELTNSLEKRRKDNAYNWDNYASEKRACRISFNVNGCKYRVLRQSEWKAGYPEGKINTRYYIVKTVGKRIIKEKDSPVKLTKILEEAQAASVTTLKNQDVIRERLGSTLLPF